MTKFVKIVCIGFCFGICNLRSDTFNVITVSRDIIGSYNRLATEEIYLVFAQLARCFHIDDSKTGEIIRTSDQLGEDTKASLIRRIENIPTKKISVACAPTIVVFNEAFFGKTEPLPKREQEQSSGSTSTPPEKKQRIDILDVDGIIGVYEKFRPYMSDAYLYINFLYTIPNVFRDKDFPGPIKISMERYARIEQDERQRFPSVFSIHLMNSSIMVGMDQKRILIPLAKILPCFLIRQKFFIQAMQMEKKLGITTNLLIVMNTKIS